MKKSREMMTIEELKAEIVDWSEDTIYRRIKYDGFPAVRTKPRQKPLFPRSLVLEWFKRREVRGA